MSLRQLPRPVQQPDTPEKGQYKHRAHRLWNKWKSNVPRWYQRYRSRSVVKLIVSLFLFILLLKYLFGKHDSKTRVNDDELEDQNHMKEPVYTLDSDTQLLYPPRIDPYELNPYRRANAAFVSLVRNDQIESMKKSMLQVEFRFNRKFGYPWVFFNDEPFSDEFKDEVSRMTRANVSFAQIPKEMWSYPEWIDQEKVFETRIRMAKEKIIYGGSESYRHMCRFNAGLFYNHPALKQYDWYWRVDSDIELHCDMDYDPFLFMEANNKTYGFTISLYEYEPTIPTLWDTTIQFLNKNPHHLVPHNLQDFLLTNPEQGWASSYNLCHFWSNFEIGDLRFFRSKAYQEYFDYLDKSGGIYYERWGDAPIHSLAVSFFLPRNRIHFFDDIGYSHSPWMHCPVNAKYHETKQCSCNPAKTFDYDAYSCLPNWFKVMGVNK